METSPIQDGLDHFSCHCDMENALKFSLIAGIEQLKWRRRFPYKLAKSYIKIMEIKM